MGLPSKVRLLAGDLRTARNRLYIHVTYIYIYRLTHETQHPNRHLSKQTHRMLLRISAKEGTLGCLSWFVNRNPQEDQPLWGSRTQDRPSFPEGEASLKRFVFATAFWVPDQSAGE